MVFLEKEGLEFSGNFRGIIRIEYPQKCPKVNGIKKVKGTGKYKPILIFFR